jgi:hypothetical protein
MRAVVEHLKAGTSAGHGEWEEMGGWVMGWEHKSWWWWW